MYSMALGSSCGGGQASSVYHILHTQHQHPHTVARSEYYQRLSFPPSTSSVDATMCQAL